MVSENFKYLFDKYGSPEDSQRFTSAETDSIPSEFPSLIREFYRDYGRCIIRKGLFQTCHPSDLKGVLSLIFSADSDFTSEEFCAFAFSAFGKIFCWSKRFGGCIIKTYDGEVMCIGVHPGLKPGAKIENNFYTPFSAADDSHDYFDLSGENLFRRARKTLGPLEIGQCYGFVPALALGGSPELQYLKRLSAPEHFAIVAQTMQFNLIDVQGYGNSVVVRPIGAAS